MGVRLAVLPRSSLLQGFLGCVGFCFFLGSEQKIRLALLHRWTSLPVAVTSQEIIAWPRCVMSLLLQHLWIHPVEFHGFVYVKLTLVVPNSVLFYG